MRKELGVETAAELLEQYPYKYIDRSRFYFIHEIEDEDTFVQIKGEIVEYHTMGIGRAQRMSAMFSDGHSQIELEVENILDGAKGFTDDYDGERYKSVTDEMYTNKINGYIEK